MQIFGASDPLVELYWRFGDLSCVKHSQRNSTSAGAYDVREPKSWVAYGTKHRAKRDPDSSTRNNVLRGGCRARSKPTS